MASISDAALTVNGSPHTVSATYNLSNANFSTSTGILDGGQTVNPATPAITWPNPADISYGTALGTCA